MKLAYRMTALAGLTLTAAGLYAAPDRADRALVDGAVAQLSEPGCQSRAPEGKRFVVPKADGGTRTIEICNVEDRENLAATATALSEAIDAERGKDKFYVHAKMPDLLVLRVTRARTDVDPSLVASERMKKLKAINVEISKLENEISSSADAR